MHIRFILIATSIYDVQFMRPKVEWADLGRVSAGGGARGHNGQQQGVQGEAGPVVHQSPLAERPVNDPRPIEAGARCE